MSSSPQDPSHGTRWTSGVELSSTKALSGRNTTRHCVPWATLYFIRLTVEIDYPRRLLTEIWEMKSRKEVHLGLTVLQGEMLSAGSGLQSPVRARPGERRACARQCAAVYPHLRLFVPGGHIQTTKPPFLRKRQTPSASGQPFGLP